MEKKFDLIIASGQVHVPDPSSGTKPQSLDVGVKDGKITAISDKLDPALANETFNASGLDVFPGFIDTQVHFREPGAEHKENLECGTRGAILGGITAVFEMPNTHPPTITREALEDKLKRAEKSAWCDHAFYAGACPENLEQLADLEKTPGCCGIKIFMGSSTGSLLVAEDDLINQALKNGKRRVAVHCEDEFRLKERRHLVEENRGDVRMHPVWRDETSALRATQRLVTLAEKHQRPVHILHVTTAEEMTYLNDHKQIASVECTPQHLTLYGPDCYERLGSFAQMNPPIRDKKHQEALWQGLHKGVVDIIGSDHAPHTKEEKARPYPASPSGMPGVQTILPVMLNHCNEGRLTTAKLVELMVSNPVRLFKIKDKGKIALDYKADFSIVDMGRSETIHNSQMANKSGWTPFDGMKVTGWPVATIIRGQVVMKDGHVLGTPAGKPLEFEDLSY